MDWGFGMEIKLLKNIFYKSNEYLFRMINRFISMSHDLKLLNYGLGFGKELNASLDKKKMGL